MNKDKQKPMKNIARLHCFIDGAKAIHANAAALYEEAQILGQAGAFARAAVLHQISMEECSKVDMLGAAAVSLLAGEDVDEELLARKFRDHKAKNRANAYNAEQTDEERSARERRDWHVAMAAFKDFQSAFHKGMNDIKNMGLYVDFKDGIFSSPTDIVDEATAVSTMHLNADFLRRGDDFVRLMTRFGDNPERFEIIFRALATKIESSKLDAKVDPEKVMSMVLEEMRLQIESSAQN